MTNRLHHERIYRGNEVMQKLAQCSVLLCGAGALGSNLAVNLARCGFGKLTVIDHDRIEEHNVGTQVFSLEDVGARKAEILRNIIYREVGADVVAHAQELTEKNIAKLMKGATLVVDAFDNSRSRKLVRDYCAEFQIACLHTGVNNEYGEIIWNDNYRVPSDVGLDLCDYPLARTLIMLVVTVANEVLIRYAATGEKSNYSVTMGDLSINRETCR